MNGRERGERRGEEMIIAKRGGRGNVGLAREKEKEQWKMMGMGEVGERTN